MRDGWERAERCSTEASGRDTWAGMGGQMAAERAGNAPLAPDRGDVRGRAQGVPTSASPARGWGGRMEADSTLGSGPQRDRQDRRAGRLAAHCRHLKTLNEHCVVSDFHCAHLQPKQTAIKRKPAGAARWWATTRHRFRTAREPAPGQGVIERWGAWHAAHIPGAGGAPARRQRFLRRVSCAVP